jgi:chromosomal replication initiation ATPase DnaA
MDVWQEICRQLESSLSRENFESWIEPVRYGEIDSSRTLHLIAPNPSAKQWLETEYQDRIVDTAQALQLNVAGVVFKTEGLEQERGAWPMTVAPPVQGILDFRER